MITYSNSPPHANAFITLRSAEGWGTITTQIANKAIENTLYWVTAYEGELLIGFGRVVGDGALNYYIQDVIVAKTHRSEGVGEALMKKLISVIKSNAVPGAQIGLMSVAGIEPFYKKLGFTQRPDGRFGAGMTLDI